VLLIGTKLAGGTATDDEFVQVTDELTSDALFGEGSELALMVRKALETGRGIGFQPEIWATPIADPAGTAATFTLTVATGSATVAGDIVFRIGEAIYRAGVSVGDDQTAIALAIKAAIDEKLEQAPVTAGAAVGVVTLTLNQTGVNGNDLKVIVDDVGLIGLTVTAAAVVAGVGAAVLTSALSNSLSKFFEIVAIANHTAADVTAMKAHLDLAWAPSEKRWLFAVMGENGTLATANGLATAANDYRQVFASYEDSPAMPGLIAAAIATTVAARELPNYNWDNHKIPLSSPPDAAVYTDAELEVALAAGSTPIKPNDARDSSFVARMITSKTTEGGNPFERVKDLATVRGLVYTTRQMEARFSQQFQAENKSDLVLRRMRSVAFGVLVELEDLGVVQNIDELFPQLVVDTDPLVPTRAVVSIPESIIPNLHQIVLKHVLFVE
jgi:phage tail sheath gpL-like